jgi:hypothetical protein
MLQVDHSRVVVLNASSAKTPEEIEAIVWKAAFQSGLGDDPTVHFQGGEIREPVDPSKPFCKTYWQPQFNKPGNPGITPGLVQIVAREERQPGSVHLVFEADESLPWSPLVNLDCQPGKDLGPLTIEDIRSALGQQNVELVKFND